jgi:hypothetical protein
MKRSAAALLVDLGVAIVGAGVALALYWSVGLTFTPWANYISDLSIGPGGSSIVFIVMMVLMAVASGWFFVDSAGSLKRKFGSAAAVNIGRLFGLIHVAAVIFMVFFPLDPGRPTVFTTHIVAGIVLFACMAVFLVAYAVVFSKGSRLYQIAAYCAAASAVLCLAFAVLLTLTELFGTLPRHAFIYLLEWGAFGMYLLWLLLGGLALRGDAVKS